MTENTLPVLPPKMDWQITPFGASRKIKWEIFGSALLAEEYAVMTENTLPIILPRRDWQITTF